MGKGDVQVIFTAVDNVSKKCHGIGGAIQGLGKVVTVAGAAIGAAMTAAGVATLAYIGHATMAASRTSELGVILNLLGERAGYTTEEIKGQVQAMKDVGIRTDVAQSLLAQFARYQLDAADATKIARVAQDAAVLSMQDSSEALDQIMHGILTQNSLVLRNAGLNIMAGAAMDKYAESIGKTAQDLTETERIQAMMNAVMEEGERIAGSYEAAMREPGKQMRSFGRYLYEVSESIGQHFLPVLGTAVFAISDFIKEIRGLLEEGQPLHDLFQAVGRLAGFATEKLFGLAGEGIGGLAASIIPAIEKITAIVDDIRFLWLAVDKGWLDPLDAIRRGLTSAFGSEMADKIMGIVDGVTGFFNKVSEIVQPIVDWMAKNVELKDVLLGLGVAVATVVIPILWAILSPLLTIIAVAAALALAVAGLRAAWENDFLGIRTFVTDTFASLKAWWAEHGEEIIARAKEIYDTVKDAISTAITTVRETIANVLAGILAFWAENGEEIMAKATEIWETIKTVVQTVIDHIRPAIQTFVENVKANLDKFGPVIEAVKGIFAALGPYLQAILTVAAGIVMVVVGIIVGLFNGLANAIGSIIAGVCGILTGLITFLTGWMQILTGIFQLIIGLVTGDGEKIKQAWESIKTGVVNIVEGLITAIVAAFEGIWGAICGFLAGLVEGIINFFTDLWDRLVGHSIVPDMIEAIVQWFRELPGKAVDAAMAGLGMFLDLGRSLMDSLVQGVVGGVGALGDAVKNAAQGALDAAKRLLGIGSPSKVFVGLGGNLMKSMAKGVLDELNAATGAVTAGLGGMLKGITGGLDLAARGPAAAAARAAGDTIHRVTNITVTGNYAYQSEQTLVQELRLAAAMYG